MMLWLWLMAAPALAGKTPVLTPLTTALTAPLDKDGDKVLKYASNCKEGELQWRRLIEMRTAGLTQITDAMGANLLCWHTAEKKALKVGEPIAPLTAYITAWTRVMETKKDFYWVMEAIMQGDARHICKRVFTSQERAQAAFAAAQGLPTLFTAEETRPLIAEAYGEAELSVRAMEQLYAEQNCAGREVGAQ